MTSISDHPKWTRDEFLAFLLIYAAKADMYFSADEKDFILKKIDAGVLASVELEYNALSDYEHIQIIQSYRDQFFDDDATKESLLSEVRTLFGIDGHFSIEEHSMYLMLKKIL